MGKGWAMFGRKARVKCFNATYGAGSFMGRADLGYQLVPVEQIVGSVGRCEELDDRFRPLVLTRSRRERLQRIRQLVDQGTVLPPVELYKLKDEYFVVDGHHRVAVAKENGQIAIDAYVVEFLPAGERPEDRLYLEYRAFANETGLQGIRLTRLGGYSRLRREIEEHRAALGGGAEGAVELRQAADDWYRKVYLPAARAIEARHLRQRLRGRTVGDIYLELQARRAFARQEEQREISLGEAMEALEALYPRPTLRERLALVWTNLLGSLQAWWQGLQAEDLPCAHAAQGGNGSVYCRRAARTRRGEFRA